MVGINKVMVIYRTEHHKKFMCHKGQVRECKKFYLRYVPYVTYIIVIIHTHTYIYIYNYGV
jgi:hypothetical protein